METSVPTYEEKREDDSNLQETLSQPSGNFTTLDIVGYQQRNEGGSEVSLEKVELDEDGDSFNSQQSSRLSKVLARRNRYFSPYQRFFSIVILGNLAGMIYYLWKYWYSSSFPISTIITASASNILAVILIRQEYIVNYTYLACWYIPHYLPLRLRAAITKIYEHGGLHSGAAAAGTAWFILLTIIASYDFARGVLHSIPMLVICYVLLLLLAAILIFALQPLRFKNHNTFEMTHRFAGWTSVGLFWVEVMLFVHNTSQVEGKSFGTVLIHEPSFWILIIITFHLVLPWLRLHKMEFTSQTLSDHAIRLDFKGKYPPISGVGLSTSPLMEWHPFAAFPNPHGGPNCHSVIISFTGDWTRKQVDQARPKYWVKGIPKIGLLSLAFMFPSVLVVTTGSGIGPCLSFLLTSSSRRKHTACRVIWSSPSPVSTYGSDLYHGVLRADPNAMIIDTKIAGRPDLLKLSYSVWKKSGAEAVFVISNRKVTRMVVDGLEEMGVHAFGPIWDS